MYTHRQELTYMQVIPRYDTINYIYVHTKARQINLLHRTKKINSNEEN